MKYFTRGVAVSFVDEDVCITASEIILDDYGPTFTGLYDHAGQEIYRQSSRVPVGYKVNQWR